MKKIPVKIGWELVLICLSLFIFPILKWNLEGFIVEVVTNIFIISTVFGIRYSIDGDYFLIKVLLSRTIKININEISKIEKTSNLLSSPAPSLFGRVEIYYQHNSIVISPKNFEEFKHEMLAINPNIDFKN